MMRVAILGASGYTALELIKLLLRHPEVEISVVTSRQEEGVPLSAVHPSLAGRIDLGIEHLAPDQIAERADCVFSCLPHGVTASLAGSLLATGLRLIDFSADYRLDDATEYAAWYGQEHPDPERLPNVVYGLPELFRTQICEADIVANPGCYPTSAILGLAPLVQSETIATDDIIIDSKSGVSGAGRSPKLTTHYPECNESLSAYNIGRHRHTPEIELILSKTCGKPVEVIFTPHLIPMDRGILTTMYSRPLTAVREADLFELFHAFYAPHPFVRVVKHLPATKDAAHTNFCDITLRVVKGRVLTISCLDNLIKGAAGAAVQNFNLMCGFPETMSF
jgi:N-acetyl-gamma-glutamyl-phosphate reductase